MVTVPDDGAARVRTMCAHGIRSGCTSHPDDGPVADVSDRMPGRRGRVRAEAHPSELRDAVQRRHDGPGSLPRARAVGTGNPDARRGASGMPAHARVRAAAERAVPDRARLGLDVSFPYPSVELARVRVCCRATDQVDRVLGGNGHRPSIGEARPDTVM